MAASSQSASSSNATAVSSVSRVSRRSDSVADGSTGASALRSSCSMSKLECASAILLQPFLELADCSVNQHLGGAFAAAERTGDLAVVHVQGEAHDQRRLPVLGEVGHAGEHVAQLLSTLDELVRAMALRERAGVVEVGLRPA